MGEIKIKKLLTITQAEVFPNMEEVETVFEDRLTGKSIVLDNEGKMALVGAAVNNIYTLPGGGIKTNESVEEGVIREAREEIGCVIHMESMLGVIDDYRNRDKKHCISYCAIAKVVGDKGEPELTEEEKENGLHVIWVSKEEAFKILEEEMSKVKTGDINFYNTAFNVMRDFEFVKKYLG